MATAMLPDLVLVEVFKRTLHGSSRADRTWKLFQLSHVCRDWERIVATNGSLFESTQIRLYRPLERLDVSDSEDGFIPDASEHAQRILRINRRSHLLLKWQMSELIRHSILHLPLIVPSIIATQKEVTLKISHYHNHTPLPVKLPHVEQLHLVAMGAEINMNACFLANLMKQPQLRALSIDSRLLPAVIKGAGKADMKITIFSSDNYQHVRSQ